MTTLEELAKEAASCTRCDLYQRATATVLGEGRPHPPLALVGEQPGDQEDKQGHPFVGPAGDLLDCALHDSGIERAGAYVTNAVKHFKWRPAAKWAALRFPDGNPRLIHAAAYRFRYSSRASCGVRYPSAE